MSGFDNAKYNVGEEVTFVNDRNIVTVASISRQSGSYFYNVDFYGGGHIMRVPEKTLRPVGHHG